MNTCQSERTIASTHVYYINKNIVIAFRKSAKKKKGTNKMGWWTLAASATGAASGLLGQWAANRANRQLNQVNREHEFALLNQEQQFASQQAELSDIRQRALYNELMSPEALRQQYENAGLSVGLMYGQGGAGGNLSTGAQADSPSAQNRGTIPMMSLVGSETQRTMAEAEKNMAEAENIKEDTKKKEAETASTWRDLPVKEKQLIVMENSIERTQTEIKVLNEQVKTEVEKQINLAKDSGKKEAETEYTNALRDYTQSQQKIAEMLATAQEKEMLAHANQMNASARKLNIEAKTLESTFKYTVQEACYNSALKHIELIKAPLEVGQAQAELDKLLEEAYEHGVDNQMYKKIEEKFGKTTASVIKNGAEMISVVLKGVGSAVMKVPVPK